MFKIPETENLKEITSYCTLEQLTILKDICHKIYIARNITNSFENVIENLERIDKIFKIRENKN